MEMRNICKNYLSLGLVLSWHTQAHAHAAQTHIYVHRDTHMRTEKIERGRGREEENAD